MSYDQYWYGDPLMVRAFYAAHKLKQEQQDYNAWLHGLYVYQGVSTALYNAFRDPKKGQKAENYPDKPFGMKKQEESQKIDEEAEKTFALAYMTSMVAAGKNWGKGR